MKIMSWRLTAQHEAISQETNHATTQQVSMSGEKKGRGRGTSTCQVTDLPSEEWYSLTTKDACKAPSRVLWRHH